MEATQDIAPAFILQDLYNSESNYTIATFWDASFPVLLGDDLNGFVAEARTQPSNGSRPKLSRIIQILNSPRSTDLEARHRESIRQ
ncbi:hypothetical protein ACWAUC_18865 [Bradyrhizobium guangdongense]